MLAETRETHAEAVAALRSEIVTTTVDLFGPPPDDDVRALPRSLLKTSSGKIRRAASREIYEPGAVGARPKAVLWQLARLRVSAAVLAMVLPPSFRAGEAFERRPVSGFVLWRIGAEFVERIEREPGVIDTDRLVAVVRGGRRC